MAKDLGDALGTAIGKAAREAAQSVATNSRKGANGPLSGMRGLAAGAGLAALAPVAVKGAGKLVKRGVPNGASPVKKAGEKLGGGVKDAVGKSVSEAGGAAGMAKEAGKQMLPGGGNGKSKGQPGVGKGRRMPVQQAVDVAVPITVAYNQWTQFEEWPNFMHRLERVTQRDPCHVAFKAKIWGISREFDAEIVEQRPDERIKWRVTDGVTHTGVVTFHELADRLTRIEVNIDIQPDSLLEKAGRGLRHAKRAIRADLSRFKAYVEMEEHETGAWRGVIDDGKLKRRTSSSSAKTSRSSSSRSSRSSSSSKSSRSNGSAKRPSSSSSSSNGSNKRSSSSSGSAKRSSSAATSRSRSSRTASGGRSRSKSSSSGSKSGGKTTRSRS